MMKWIGWAALLVMVAAAVLVIGAKREENVWTSVKDPEALAVLRHFVEIKEAQAAGVTNGMQPEIQVLFDEAKRGSWGNFTNSFRHLGEQIGEFRVRDPKPLLDGVVSEKVGDWLESASDRVGLTRYLERRREAEGEANEKVAERVKEIPWEAIYEVEGAEETFMTGDEKYVMEYAREITNGLPAGAIYFGNTDAGLFVVEAMEQSHPDGNPFLTLSQNEISHSTYLSYVRPMYGNKLNVPTERGVSWIINDEAVRLSLDKTPSVHESIPDWPDVFILNLLKMNPGRQFYSEPFSANDELFSRMEPHGSIVKINPDPITVFPTILVSIDREYWDRQVSEKLGGWLRAGTSIQDIADFAEVVHEKGDLTAFHGDVRFIKSDAAGELYGNARAAIAQLYAWRADHAGTPGEKKYMTNEADYAYRQAWAMCPESSKVVWPFVGFLTNEKRFDEAILVATVAKRMPENSDTNTIWWIDHGIDHIKDMKAKAASP